MDLPKKSSLFGESLDLNEEEQDKLNEMVKESPVAVFQALNKHLNELGFLISVKTVPKEESE